MCLGRAQNGRREGWTGESVSGTVNEICLFHVLKKMTECLLLVYGVQSTSQKSGRVAVCLEPRTVTWWFAKFQARHINWLSAGINNSDNYNPEPDYQQRLRNSPNRCATSNSLLLDERIRQASSCRSSRGRGHSNFGRTSQRSRPNASYSAPSRHAAAIPLTHANSCILTSVQPPRKPRPLPPLQKHHARHDADVVLPSVA